MTAWKATKHQDLVKEITKKVDRLRTLKNQEGPEDISVIPQLDYEMAMMNDQEDIKWRQRAKQEWYSLEDKNTNFSHAYATQCQHHNKISTIFD